jgi:hypothetical protein
MYTILCITVKLNLRIPDAHIDSDASADIVVQILAAKIVQRAAGPHGQGQVVADGRFRRLADNTLDVFFGRNSLGTCFWAMRDSTSGDSWTVIESSLTPLQVILRTNHRRCQPQTATIGSAMTC